MKFDDWFYEREGFGLRCERFFAEFPDVNPVKAVAWLKVAYEVGREAALDEAAEAAAGPDI